MVARTIPCNNTLRCLNFTAAPWLLHKISLTSSRSVSFTSIASFLSPIHPSTGQEPDASTPPTISYNSNDNRRTPVPTKESESHGHPPPYFPKRGQTIELVCESLAFKGKGVCRVAETGFVVMCDRALPGERFIGRVTRRKGSYAEVKKLKTLSPHSDYVDAPCIYATYCGGCKTQNLSYKAQLKVEAQQVHDLVVHVGKFAVDNIIQPIVPCAKQFHYRNKMEFSFSSERWVPKEMLEVDDYIANDMH